MVFDEWRGPFCFFAFHEHVCHAVAHFHLLPTRSNFGMSGSAKPSGPIETPFQSWVKNQHYLPACTVLRAWELVLKVMVQKACYCEAPCPGAISGMFRLPLNPSPEASVQELTPHDTSIIGARWDQRRILLRRIMSFGKCMVICHWLILAPLERLLRLIFSYW